MVNAAGRAALRASETISGLRNRPAAVLSLSRDEGQPTRRILRLSGSGPVSVLRPSTSRKCFRRTERLLPRVHMRNPGAETRALGASCGQGFCEPDAGAPAALPAAQGSRDRSRLVIARRRRRGRWTGQFMGDGALNAAAVIEDCSGDGSQGDGPVLDAITGGGWLVCSELVWIHLSSPSNRCSPGHGDIIEGPETRRDCAS
jgi:hypothetical protein